MHSFLGLVYLIGVKKLDELWSNDGTSPEYFITTMSKRRFQTLVQAIRFDDETSRDEKKKMENLASIRQKYYIFTIFCKQG